MVVMKMVEEEVGKTWDQAATIHSVKERKGVPGIPIRS